MRRFVYLFIVLLLACRADVFAGVTVKTLGGKVYQNAEVKEVGSGVVVLLHEGGVVRIPFSNLSNETRKSLKIKPTVKMLKRDFDNKIRGFKNTLFELDVTYSNHLSKLEKESQARGQLEQVLAVKKELAEFRAAAKPEKFEFEKLEKLRVIYDKARVSRRNKIIDELKVALKQFRSGLKELQKTLTVEGKVDEAIEAKNEEDKVIALLMDRKQALDTLAIFTASDASFKPAPAPAVSKSPAAMTNSADTAASATKGKPFENSLGMRFVPVPIIGGPSDGQRVLFSIWETRVADYEAFIQMNSGRNWPAVNFPQGDDHPAANILWGDAEAFCLWLTEKEQKSGEIAKDERYRLPSDHEWSCAVGIGGLEEAKLSPALKKFRNQDVYPWGKKFPPPAGKGNFYGEETKRNPFQTNRVPIAGYDDGFDRTAPVGSFAANEFGLYDLAGNVSEWGHDWYDPAKKEHRVFRGGGWYLYDEGDLKSSARAGGHEKFASSGLGFRVVLESGTAGNQAVDESNFPSNVAVKTVDETGSASKEIPFQNELGMRFVPVPIIGGPSDGKRVLFSVWETRVADYDEFIKNRRQVEWPKTPHPQRRDHAAGNVSWGDAVAFCAWLTGLSRQNGELGEKEAYRLPTDHEWSCAVGIGAMEDAEASPVSKSRKLENVFPWGSGYPPPEGAGNYNGEEADGDRFVPLEPISGYNDGFIHTSPAGSYPANQFGLHDLGGNVWEWCEDWFNPDLKDKRVFRGAAFNWAVDKALLSSNRGLGIPDKRVYLVGFRVVIAVGE